MLDPMSLNPEVGAHGSSRPEDDQGAAGLWKVLLALMVRLTLAPAPVQQANAASRWPADRAQSAGGRAYRRVDLPRGHPGARRSSARIAVATTRAALSEESQTSASRAPAR